MGSFKLKVPRALRPRLEAVAAAHGFESWKATADHFVTRGLGSYGAPEGPLHDRVEHVVAEKGYSSAAELIEHLLLRGLRAYEDAPKDPEKLAARLRGLGYID